MQQADSNFVFDARSARPDVCESSAVQPTEIFKTLAEFKAPESFPARWWTVKFAAGLALVTVATLIIALNRFTSGSAVPFFAAHVAVSGLALAILGIPLTRALTARTAVSRFDWTKLPALSAAWISFFASFAAFSLYGPGSAVTMALASLPSAALAMLCLINAFETGGETASPLDSLTSLRVETAFKCVQERVEAVPTDSLKVGDVFSVRAGEKIPRDGVVLRGTTSVDKSALTGDSRPMLKERGETVVGGSLNRDGDILVQVAQERASDTLERLIQKTGHTLSTSPSACKRAGLASKAGVTLSLGLAAAAFAYATVIGGAAPLAALVPALAGLLAVPLASAYACSGAFTRLIAAARAKGIVFSAGTDVEKLARVNSVFFNKTGTLSLGDFTFSQIFIESGTNQGELLYSLFSIEQDLSHPLAKAMETHPWYIEMPAQPVRDVQIRPGLGVSAMVCPRGGAEPYLAAAGNLRFVKRMRFFVSRDMKAKMDDLEEMGETVILVGYDRQVRGILSFSDTLRKGVRDTLRKLQRLGLETALITGDTEKTVTHLTGTLGIKKIHSRCTPEEKSAKIAKERENGAHVAVVDSDQEDGSALKAADISLSLDTGTDISGCQADVLLLGPDFRLLGWLFTACRRFDRLERVYGSGGFALAAVLGVAAVTGWLPPQAVAIASLGFSALAARAAHVDA